MTDSALINTMPELSGRELTLSQGIEQKGRERKRRDRREWTRRKEENDGEQ